MIIRETGEDDLGQVMTIIRMAQQSFRDQGVDQWQDGYPNEEVILEDIRKGQSYVAEEKGIILGTAVISFEKEKTYDGIENGQWLTPVDTKYMVIHRIATHYEYKRRGTAGAFLEFARETARRRGVLSIRIDTHPDNQIMQSWLCKNGFIYCGWIWLINGSLRYAYENVL